MTLYELGASSGKVSLAELFAGRDPATSSGRSDLRDVLHLLVTADGRSSEPTTSTHSNGS